MKEWKVKQELYHRLHKDYSDDLNKVDITFSDEIVNNALKHFKEHVKDWIYPAKSYFVAYCYASWISEDYGEDFVELLNDEKLLAGNDPYFKTYKEDPETYNKIFNEISLPVPMTGMVPEVRAYYETECGLESGLVNTNI
jgi:hypothetical protein